MIQKNLRITLAVVAIVLCAVACREKKEKSEKDMKEVKAEDRTYASQVEELDKGTLPFIEKMDVAGLLKYRQDTGITVCGLYPIALLMETLKQSGKDVGMKVVDYYTSGHVTGDWTNTVSYYTIAFYEKEGGGKGGRPSGDAEDEMEGRRDGDADKPGKKRVRPMATGPEWFPKSEGPLRREIDSLLKKAESAVLPGQLLALIAPHAGYRFSGRAAAAGFRLLDRKTERVVLLGVPHRVRVKGVSLAPYDYYDTPLGPAAVDTSVMNRLAKHDLFGSVPQAHAKEHSIEVLVPFVRHVSESAKIVPFLVGFMTFENYVDAARELAPLLDDGTVFIASSDFAHIGPRFGYEPFGKQR